MLYRSQIMPAFAVHAEVCGAGYDMLAAESFIVGIALTEVTAVVLGPW